MKKILIFCLIFVMAMCTVSCVNANVSVTYPPNYFQETTDFDNIVRKQGYESYSLNDDGSVTFVMKESLKNGILEDLRIDLDETIEELVHDELGIKSFVKIERDDDFTDFKIYVDNVSITPLETLTSSVFYYGGLAYQTVSGIPTEEQSVSVSFIDNETGVVINTKTHYEF